MIESVKPENIAQMNQASIIRLLKVYGNLSRADITRMLGMSFPSVSQNIKLLLEGGYVQELGEMAGKDGLGRKSTLLGFNAQRGYIIGVYFNINSIVAVAADLIGNIITIVEKMMSINENGEHAYTLIRKAICDVMEQSEIAIENLECICIGIPGVFDETTRKNRLVPYLQQWEDIRIYDRLKTDFIDNILVENVVNLGVIGEQWKGRAQEYQSIIYVDYHIGISAGILINGELVRGTTGMAGEVGYMLLAPESTHKYYTTEGALEEKVSGVVLSKLAKSMGCETDEQFSVSSLIQMGMNGEQEALKIVEQVVTYIAAMIVNTISVVNPEVIILSGLNGIEIGRKYMDRIKNIVKMHVPEMPKITVSDFSSSQAAIFGAVKMAILHAPSNIDNQILDRKPTW